MVSQANDKQNLLYNDDAMQINDDLGKDGEKLPTKKSSRRSSKLGDKGGDLGGANEDANNN
jgi:hypothetical protein